MSEIKQEHSYSEFHDFSVEGVNLIWAADNQGVDMLVEEAGDTFSLSNLSDERLASIRDLINEFLLWKKYRYTATINEGDSFKIRTKAELEAVVAVASEDATGVPF